MRTTTVQPPTDKHGSGSDSDEYTIPLQDQRVFGAGLKRKRIHFVPSSAPQPSPQPSTGPSISERYLSLVLPPTVAAASTNIHDPEGEPADESFTSTSKLDGQHRRQQEETETEAETENTICDICNLPLRPSTSAYIHDATLPHQVSLPHSHPPSSISRARLGLRILESQGWDPDGRVGLGREGEGRQFPVKIKEKDDRLGVGVVVPRAVEDGMDGAGKGRVLGGRERGIKRLDAKEVRREAEKEKKKGDRLREMFYGSEEVERYLRG